MRIYYLKFSFSDAFSETTNQSYFLLIINQHQSISSGNLFPVHFLLISCAAATIGSHCCTYCHCRIALLAEQFQIQICYFPDLSVRKSKICHCCICTCISLCCMRPVNHSHLSILSYDHITRIEVSVAYFIMLWHTLKSCQKFITCCRIKIFQSVDLAG